jgi:hypothetical protein
VDFGDEGCMTSYSVGFEDEKLKFLKAISNQDRQKQLDNYQYGIDWGILEKTIERVQFDEQIDETGSESNDSNELHELFLKSP